MTDLKPGTNFVAHTRDTLPDTISFVSLINKIGITDMAASTDGMMTRPLKGHKPLRVLKK